MFNPLTYFTNRNRVPVALAYTAKLSPQPQVLLALGLLK
jgi:hypothetical protein